MLLSSSFVLLVISTLIWTTCQDTDFTRNFIKNFICHGEYIVLINNGFTFSDQESLSCPRNKYRKVVTRSSDSDKIDKSSSLLLTTVRRALEWSETSKMVTRDSLCTLGGDAVTITCRCYKKCNGVTTPYLLMTGDNSEPEPEVHHRSGPHQVSTVWTRH